MISIRCQIEESKHLGYGLKSDGAALLPQGVTSHPVAIAWCSVQKIGEQMVPPVAPASCRQIPPGRRRYILHPITGHYAN
jgi:hypothetical protein